MNVLIDSFGWIEYFGEGSLAGKYAKYIEKANQREYFTPSIVIYEVYKKIKKSKKFSFFIKALSLTTARGFYWGLGLIIGGLQNFYTRARR